MGGSKYFCTYQGEFSSTVSKTAFFYEIIHLFLKLLHFLFSPEHRGKTSNKWEINENKTTTRVERWRKEKKRISKWYQQNEKQILLKKECIYNFEQMNFSHSIIKIIISRSKRFTFYGLSKNSIALHPGK